MTQRYSYKRQLTYQQKLNNLKSMLLPLDIKRRIQPDYQLLPPTFSPSKNKLWDFLKLVWEHPWYNSSLIKRPYQTPSHQNRLNKQRFTQTKNSGTENLRPLRTKVPQITWVMAETFHIQEPKEIPPWSFL